MVPTAGPRPRAVIGRSRAMPSDRGRARAGQETPAPTAGGPGRLWGAPGPGGRRRGRPRSAAGPRPPSCGRSGTGSRNWPPGARRAHTPQHDTDQRALRSEVTGSAPTRSPAPVATISAAATETGTWQRHRPYRARRRPRPPRRRPPRPGRRGEVPGRDDRERRRDHRREQPGQAGVRVRVAAQLQDDGQRRPDAEPAP